MNFSHEALLEENRDKIELCSTREEFIKKGAAPYTSPKFQTISVDLFYIPSDEVENSVMK